MYELVRLKLKKEYYLFSLNQLVIVTVKVLNIFKPKTLTINKKVTLKRLMD